MSEPMPPAELTLLSGALRSGSRRQTDMKSGKASGDISSVSLSCDNLTAEERLQRVQGQGENFLRNDTEAQ